MERVVLAGGSGFLGGVLARKLVERGYGVVVLTRRARGKGGRGDGVREVAWDGRTVGDWARELEGAAAVINLAGKNVNCRYTAAARREILESRVDSVKALAGAMARCGQGPRVFVQCASAAIYGNAGEAELEEGTRPAPPAGEDPFSPNVCQAWELAVHAAEMGATRKVILRIGFVLHAEGGALATLARITRCFLGGRAGSGRQFMSWIHHEDFAEVVLRVVEKPEAFAGTYLAVSPSPTRNGEFMRALRRALHRPWSPPAPVWAIRAACFFMRTEPELALRSRRCYPRRLEREAGFAFAFPTIEGALGDCFSG